MTSPENAANETTEAIRRTIDLDITTDDLWDLIATAAGWQAWLADEASVTVAPGEHGVITDDGQVKRVAIHTVHERERVTFTWWNDDDPTTVTAVELHVGPGPDGLRRLSIIEQPAHRTGVARALAGGLAGASAMRWEVRAVSIWACTVRCAVRA